MAQFQRHLEIILSRISSGRPFSLTRYGDGERAILQGQAISTFVANRHWCFRPDEGIAVSGLSTDLGEAFDCSDPAWYVGISDPCCNELDSRYYFERLGPSRLSTHTTFANVFCNGNWKFLAARFTGAVSAVQRPVLIITHWNKDFKRARQSLPYNEVFIEGAGAAEYDKPIPSKLVPGGFYHGGCTLWYTENRKSIVAQYREIAQSFHGALVFLALGPVAKILAHVMFVANPNNIYIDMGHVLDGLLFGELTRGYMLGEPSRSCADMEVGFNL